MTVAVLDAPGAKPAPYLEWLAPDVGDVVLLTGRPAGELAACDIDGYAGVRSFGLWSSGLVDRHVIALAESATLSAIVAVAPADAIRAGALRDLVGLRGQGRTEALALHDLVAQRQRLDAAGVPAVASWPVRHACDLWWCAWRWGYPLIVRARRVPGWPSVAELRDAAAIRRFTRGALSPRLESLPSLVVEPAVAGPRHELSIDVDDHGRAHVEAGAPAAVAAALDALRVPAAGTWRVSLVQPAGAGTLVDVVCDAGAPTRARVRAQAGLRARPRERVR